MNQCEFIGSTLKEVIDFEFVCASFYDFGSFAGYYTYGDVEHFAPEDAGAIVGVEFFKFVSGLVVVHTGIGPDAVDVC